MCALLANHVIHPQRPHAPRCVAKKRRSPNGGAGILTLLRGLARLARQEKCHSAADFGGFPGKRPARLFVAAEWRRKRNATAQAARGVEEQPTPPSPLKLSAPVNNPSCAL